MKRREFIRWTGLAAGTYAFGALNRVVTAQTATQGDVTVNPLVFPQGVASADPQPHAVLLWTRAIPVERASDSLDVIVQVAPTPSFEDLVLEQPIIAVADSDFTVRVLVEDLQPDTVYYYRFIAGDGSASRTGRTLTAPLPDAGRAVSFAFVSCQSYHVGFFGSYRRLLNDDREKDEDQRIDFVLHLGDFIYEDMPPVPGEPRYYRDGSERVLPVYPSGGVPGRRNQVAAGTLDDYREVYKTYLSDPDLQAARARYPFVCIWDDHEIADNYWQSYATGRSMPRRRVEACKAWFEYVPALLSDSGSVEDVDNEARDFEYAEVEEVAPIAPFDDDFLSLEPNFRLAADAMTVYRSLRFGRYVDLLLTDLRSYRSPYASLPHSPDSLAGLAEPPEAPLTDLGDDVLAILAAGRTWADGNPPETIDVNGTEIANPRRDAPPVTMLGARQKAWFKRSLRRSDAVWKVWGNSVPALRLGLDLSRIDELLPDPLLWPETTWDGFPNERNEMMAYLEENGVTNVVSLSGDRHMHAAGLVARDFLAEPHRYVMPDFTVSSISTTTRMEITVRPIRDLGEDFAPLVYYTDTDEDGTERRVPNLNVTLRHGIRSGLAVAESRDPAAAAAAAHRTPNPHIRYLETYAHGYGIARFDAEAATVEFVAIDPPTRFEHHGRQGPPAKHRSLLRVNTWSAGEEPQIERVWSEGEPIFGDLA